MLIAVSILANEDGKFFNCCNHPHEKLHAARAVSKADVPVVYEVVRLEQSYKLQSIVGRRHMEGYDRQHHRIDLVLAIADRGS
jgi:hypothetical protein